MKATDRSYDLSRATNMALCLSLPRILHGEYYSSYVADYYAHTRKKKLLYAILFSVYQVQDF